jgi:isoleucyl-tRNA synthetase
MANKQKEPILVDESRGVGDNLEATENFNFSNEEENILKMWNEIDAFKTQLKLSKDRKRYTFYDGPPFATGLPHYGHILAGTIKDTVTRLGYS